MSGNEYLQLKPKAKSEDLASYFGLLCDDLCSKGCRKVTIILDNNSTHKDKMKSQLKTLLSVLVIEDKIQVEFIHTPAYSPDFNLVEYIIHLLRLRFLHHLPLNMTIEQIEQKLDNYFSSHQLQTSQQIKNTIRHICGLVR